MTARTWASLAGVGLFTAVAAWVLHQQTGIILASWACENEVGGIWNSGLVAIVLLLAGAGVSRLAWARINAGGLNEASARPRHFMAVIAMLASALFLFAILLAF